MAALTALLVFANVQAAHPTLADHVPQMTAAVVNVRAQKSLSASSLPLVGSLLPRHAFSAVGSGVIVDRRGLIVTNHHIVSGAAHVVVTLSDDREFEAEVVGSDRQLDLALLRVEPDEPLTPARFGRSSSLRVGDSVVAVGSPYGLPRTVTSGIVSARGRLLPGVRPAVPLLQTDAPINPGNSGGPLFDVEGRVVGINTAMVIGARGIGFAVPSDVVQKALPQLMSMGRIERGSIGLRLMRVPIEIERELRLPSATQGALVREVTPDGPGARSGIQPGDVIVQVDGAPVDDSDTLSAMIALTPPGKSMRLRLLRDGTTMVRDVLVAAARLAE
jgi:serine protease Do